MSGSRPLFRKAALDRLSSPDQLDRLIAITLPLDWLALIALGLLCAAAVLWSVLGDIPTRIPGRGILVSQGGGVIDATTNAPGTLITLHVRPGDHLRKGDLVAELLQPAARQTLEHARAEVTDLRADAARLEAQLARQLAAKQDARDRERASLREVFAGARQRADYNRQALALLQEPASRSLITHQRVQDITQAQQDGEQEMKRVTSDLARLDAADLDDAAHRDDLLTTARAAIVAAERHLAELQDQFDVTSKVVAPADGEVIELKASEGTYLPVGLAVASLQTGAAGLDAVLFIPAEHGKKVRPGMRVLITPATVNRAEQGAMVGQVAAIASFPATAQGMEAVLRNPDLVRAFSRDGLPYAARVALLGGADGRYVWTARVPPDVTITGGTLVSAEVTVAHQHPLALVLPLFGAMGESDGTESDRGGNDGGTAPR